MDPQHLDKTIVSAHDSLSLRFLPIEDLIVEIDILRLDFRGILDQLFQLAVFLALFGVFLSCLLLAKLVLEFRRLDSLKD